MGKEQKLQKMQGPSSRGTGSQEMGSDIKRETGP